MGLSSLERHFGGQASVGMLFKEIRSSGDDTRRPFKRAIVGKEDLKGGGPLGSGWIARGGDAAKLPQRTATVTLKKGHLRKNQPSAVSLRSIR